MITSDYRGAGRYEVLVDGVQREVFEVKSEQDFKRIQQVHNKRYFGRKKYRRTSSR